VTQQNGLCHDVIGFCLPHVPCVYVVDVTFSGLSGSGWTKEVGNRNYASGSPPPAGGGWRELAPEHAANGSAEVTLAPVCGYTREYSVLLKQDGTTIDGALIKTTCDGCGWITVIDP
jgi:hypothetical protein